jgi:hypothetical protein
VPEQEIPGSEADGYGRAAALTVTDEQTRWVPLSTTAAGAFTFWKDFFILRMGPSNDQNLSPAAINNFMTIIRAVSWVESKHGTAGANFPARDPMQCGNPADVWWQQLIALGSPVPGRERFVTGPGGSNYWAEELPGAVAPIATFPDQAEVGHLADKRNGHRDARFNPQTSFYWGVPFLIQKINKIPSGATYKCDDASRERMINGAVAYNGGGDPNYRRKIEEAWELITRGLFFARPGPGVADEPAEIVGTIRGFESLSDEGGNQCQAFVELGPDSGAEEAVFTDAHSIQTLLETAFVSQSVVTLRVVDDGSPGRRKVVQVKFERR